MLKSWWNLENQVSHFKEHLVIGHRSSLGLQTTATHWSALGLHQITGVTPITRGDLRFSWGFWGNLWDSMGFIFSSRDSKPQEILVIIGYSRSHSHVLMLFELNLETKCWVHKSRWPCGWTTCWWGGTSNLLNLWQWSMWWWKERLFRVCCQTHWMQSAVLYWYCSSNHHPSSTSHYSSRSSLSKFAQRTACEKLGS